MTVAEKKPKAKSEREKPAGQDVRAIPVGEVAVSLPFMLTGHYRKHRIAGKLSGRQSAALRAIFDGLQDTDGRNERGHAVLTQEDALRYILDRAADGLGLDERGQKTNRQHD